MSHVTIQVVTENDLIGRIVNVELKKDEMKFHVAHHLDEKTADKRADTKVQDFMNIMLVAEIRPDNGADSKTA